MSLKEEARFVVVIDAPAGWARVEGPLPDAPDGLGVDYYGCGVWKGPFTAEEAKKAADQVRAGFGEGPSEVGGSQ